MTKMWSVVSLFVVSLFISSLFVASVFFFRKLQYFTCFATVRPAGASFAGFSVLCQSLCAWQQLDLSIWSAGGVQSWWGVDDGRGGYGGGQYWQKTKIQSNFHCKFQVQLDSQMVEDLAIDADLLRFETALSLSLKLGRKVLKPILLKTGFLLTFLF